MSTYLLLSVLKKVREWINPSGFKRIMLIFLISGFALLIGAMVYLSGGSTYVFSHTMYIPIILSSIIFGVRGAIISSILCGLILGPYMPITTVPLVFQSYVNWIYRIVVFLINSLIIAFVSEVALKILNKMEKSLSFDSRTMLPNTFSLKRKMLEESEAGRSFYIANLLLGNYSETVGALGYEKYASFISNYAKYLKNNYDFIDEIYFLKNNNLAFVLHDKETLDVFMKNIASLRKKMISTDELISYPDIYVGIIENDKTASKLFRTIDKSNYLASQAFKAKIPVLIYNDAIDSEIIRNHMLISSFPDAVKNNQIELYFQPQILLSEKRIIGAEALVRWLHPEKGMIPPMAWVPVIENTGLIDTLTEFVLEETIKQLKIWEKMGIDICASINVSTYNLTYEFADVVINKLKEYDIEPHKLELEITETSLFNNIKEVIKIMEYLSSHGIVFSIDDFGTGFSSLSYLKELPVKYLKIDQIFIRNIENDAVSEAITKSIIQISDLLKISIVAEGIENEISEKILTENKCHIGQGFYYSKPLPIEEFNTFYNNFQLKNL